MRTKIFWPLTFLCKYLRKSRKKKILNFKKCVATQILSFCCCFLFKIYHQPFHLWECSNVNNQKYILLQSNGKYATIELYLTLYRSASRKHQAISIHDSLEIKHYWKSQKQYIRPWYEICKFKEQISLRGIQNHSNIKGGFFLKYWPALIFFYYSC